MLHADRLLLEGVAAVTSCAFPAHSLRKLGQWPHHDLVLQRGFVLHTSFLRVISSKGAGMIILARMKQRTRTVLQPKA